MSPNRAEPLTWCSRCSKVKAWHTPEKHWEPLQGGKCPSGGFSGLEYFQMECIFQVRLGEQQRFCRTHHEALWAPLFVDAFPELCLSSPADMACPLYPQLRCPGLCWDSPLVASRDKRVFPKRSAVFLWTFFLPKAALPPRGQPDSAGWERACWCYYHYHYELINTFGTALGLSCGMWDLVPWPEIQPGSPALRMKSLSRWTTWEIPTDIIIIVNASGWPLVVPSRLLRVLRFCRLHLILPSLTHLALLSGALNRLTVSDKGLCEVSCPAVFL